MAGHAPGPTLIALGTANRDYSVSVDHHPHPGETVLGNSFSSGLGGKGANQAVAASRGGVPPVFITAVGDDQAGEELVADLERFGIDASHVVVQHGVPSGVALIVVSREGENTIVVDPGAGAALDPASTAATVAGLVTPGAVFLSQLELPLPVVFAASLSAHEAGARVVLNLSPAQAVPGALLGICDPLVVNAVEAGALTGVEFSSIADPEEAARRLLARSKSVVITLGKNGAIVADAASIRRFSAREVRVVDTTGAGDSFAGALAAALALGGSLDEAVQCGIDAAATTIQHRGAQAPSDDRIERYPMTE